MVRIIMFKPQPPSLHIKRIRPSLAFLTQGKGGQTYNLMGQLNPVLNKTPQEGGRGETTR